jgi:SAM-dependent methyltransferase
MLRRWLRAARYALATLAGGWATPHGRQNISELSWLGQRRLGTKLPTVLPDDLADGVDSINLRHVQPRDGNVSLLELTIVCALVRSAAAARIFEIGTFDGRTTANLAANVAEGGHVYTLDLPPGEVNRTAMRIEPVERKYVQKQGVAHRPLGELESRVTRLFGDSAVFDASPYAGSMDLVFVDGSHAYDYVLSDTRLAMRLIRPGGTIIWHDYASPYWPGVLRGLNELYEREADFGGLRYVQGTTLVVLRCAPVNETDALSR